MNLSSNYHSFQGEWWLGGRAGITADPDDDMLVAPNVGLTFMGNVPLAEVTLSRPMTMHTENFTGSRGKDFSMPGATGGMMKIRLEDATIKNNLIALLGGNPTTVTTGSVTGARLCRVYTTYPYYRPAAALAIGVDFAFCSQDDKGLWQPYRNLAAESVVLRDSSGTPKTLALGTNYVVKNYRNGYIRFLDITTGGAYTAPFTGNITCGLVSDTLSEHITFGTKFRLSHPDVSNLTIVDSAVSPVTVNAAYYEVFDDEGAVSFKTSQRAAFQTADYTMPLKVKFTANNSTAVPLLTNTLPPYWWVYFKGIDTANGNALVMADFYKVQFKQDALLSLIQQEGFFSADLNGEILVDHTMPAEGPMGQVGRLFPMQTYGA